LPLIVTHGWPGSITEQLKIIDPLTNPTAHGGNASDAFHIVVPSQLNDKMPKSADLRGSFACCLGRSSDFIQCLLRLRLIGAVH
jgi:hypothetical protein